MAKNIRQMAADMKRQGFDMDNQINKMVKGIAKEYFAAVVDATPVDTSKAVTNWRASLNSPLGGEVGPGVPSVKGSGASGARARAKGLAQGTINAYMNDRSLYFTNNVPYIGVLNDGSPKHKASNMLRKGLRAARAYVKTVKIVRQL